MRRNKYGNEKTMRHGIMFDSKAEAARYEQLLLIQRAGQIAGLRVHPEYALTTQGRPVGRAVFDFEYTDYSVRDGHGDPVPLKIVEDVKGCDTALSRWKRKHFAIEFGVEVKIVPVTWTTMALRRRRKAWKRPTTLGSHLRRGGSV